jgi:hypothetical protein
METLDGSKLEGVDPDLRVKPFFAQGSQFSIRAFAVGAFQDEMGLQAIDPVLSAAAAGGRVTTPSGLVLDGALDTITRPPAATAQEDPDHDGKTNEIPASLVDVMEFYLLNYFKPANYEQTQPVKKGRKHFEKIGCAVCHIPDLTIERDRRVADVETVFDKPARRDQRTVSQPATPLFNETFDVPGLPSLKTPKAGSSWSATFSRTSSGMTSDPPSTSATSTARSIRCS